MYKLILWVCACLITKQVAAQNDSAVIRKIFDEALLNGQCYDNLRVLCKTVGSRISGSPQAEKAVQWGYTTIDAAEFDTTYKQQITVPHWVRGHVEKASYRFFSKRIAPMPLHITTLGGSIGTNGKLSANIIEVHSLAALDTLGEATIKGKFVFFNRPMEPRLISTFEAYGGCVDQRSSGAVQAAKYGAVGVIVRSMSLSNDGHPHTGGMTYADGVTRIPAVAISTKEADALSLLLKRQDKVFFDLELDCKILPDTISHNVIGEIRGSEFPDSIITVGGHLDSWDIGEGAHDDGAGCVHAIEALRILKAIGYKPKHTIRVVLFMNEENGNRGGIGYAKNAKEKKETHICAIESDRGGFSPRGFDVDADSLAVLRIGAFRKLLEPYGLYQFKKGFAGVDIAPMKHSPVNTVNSNMLQMGLVPDSQRYFDFHHAETDVFESVNKRELELGAASVAAMLYLADGMFQ